MFRLPGGNNPVKGTKKPSWWGLKTETPPWNPYSWHGINTRRRHLIFGIMDMNKKCNFIYYIFLHWWRKEGTLMLEWWGWWCLFYSYDRLFSIKCDASMSGLRKWDLAGCWRPCGSNRRSGGGVWQHKYITWVQLAPLHNNNNRRRHLFCCEVEG